MLAPGVPNTDRIIAALALCAEVLDLPAVRREDNFLDLGGDSLSAIELATQLTDLLEREVVIDEFFECANFEEVFRDKV